jgi:GTP cyclohydrolase II
MPHPLTPPPSPGRGVSRSATVSTPPVAPPPSASLVSGPPISGPPAATTGRRRSAAPVPPAAPVPSAAQAPPDATIRTEVTVPLRFADGYATTARVYTFDGLVDGREHLALGLGALAGPVRRPVEPGVPLVRPHSECLTGDVFGSQRCDCGAQLREAVERVARAGGYVLYLRQEGRGIGLYAKLDAYALQDAGLDTYEANVALGHAEDERDYTVAAQMLLALGVRTVALLSNNPDKVAQLDRLGVTVSEHVPTGVHLSPTNAGYLAAKVRRGAHTLDLTDVSRAAGAAGAAKRAHRS